MNPSFWRIVLLCQPYSILTYKSPAYLPKTLWTKGLRVLIPLGNRLVVGVLLERDPLPPSDLKYKDIFWPTQTTPSFSADYLEVMHELGVRQAQPLGQVLAAVFPGEWKSTSMVFEAENGQKIKTIELRKFTPDQLQAFGKEWESGKVRVRPVCGREELAFQVVHEPPWGVRPAAKKQLELLEFLWVRGGSRKSQIKESLGAAGLRALLALQKKQLVKECMREYVTEKSPVSLHNQHPLTPQQEAALALFHKVNSVQGSQTLLLHGVTGSGKTRVYQEMIRACLGKGENVLLLAPEVAIALQLFSCMRSAFGCEQVFLFHGYQGRRERAVLFDKAMSLRGACIVGTRSTLFLPVQKQSLIILDEEHDASFKQEERLVYQAKELAWYLVRRSGGTLVLGSATPDVKTFFAARENRIELAQLPNRVADRSLPDIVTIDMKTNPPIFGGIFSRPCHQALIHCLEQGDQVIIMHNRRGYAPVVYCESCSKPYSCPYCQISLTYHKKRERLVCHYCGFSLPFPSSCQLCGGLSCAPVGEGTEKLEEYLFANLPEKTGILRLDRDSTRQKGKMEEILERFGRGEAQVLVGTQMLSKGHDFPGVTLVLVVDGDLGLHTPDYRGTERTFQLLVQVAGRAGRGEKKGRVMIQTRNPDHYCWQYIRENNYEGFYEQELELRRRFAYPPFACLGLIRISWPVQEQKGRELFALFQKMTRQEDGKKVRILGPVPSPLAMLNGRLRYQCLLKARNWQDIRQVYLRLREAFCRQKTVRLVFDPDPLNML